MPKFFLFYKKNYWTLLMLIFWIKASFSPINFHDLKLHTTTYHNKKTIWLVFKLCYEFHFHASMHMKWWVLWVFSPKQFVSISINELLYLVNCSKCSLEIICQITSLYWNSAEPRKSLCSAIRWAKSGYLVITTRN